MQQAQIEIPVDILAQQVGDGGCGWTINWCSSIAGTIAPRNGNTDQTITSTRFETVYFHQQPTQHLAQRLNIDEFFAEVS
jgi:hypothetical protein